MQYVEQIKELGKKHKLNEDRLLTVTDNAFQVFRADILNNLEARRTYRLDPTVGIVTDSTDKRHILGDAVCLRVYSPFERDGDYFAVRQRVLDTLTRWFLEEIEKQAAHSPRFNRYARKYVLFKRRLRRPWMVKVQLTLYRFALKLRHLAFPIIRPILKLFNVFGRKDEGPAMILVLGSGKEEQQEMKTIHQ